VADQRQEHGGDRERRIAVVLGKKGAGKTTLVRRWVDSYPGSVRALDPAGEFSFGEWPVGEGGKTRRQAISDWLKELTGDGRGNWEGLLILDDSDRYASVVPSEAWTDVYCANRHVGLDVIVTAHRPQGVAKELLANADIVYIFQQDEPLARKYLEKFTQIEGLADLIPTEKGRALVVVHGHPPSELIVF